MWYQSAAINVQFGIPHFNSFAEQIAVNVTGNGMPDIIGNNEPIFFPENFTGPDSGHRNFTILPFVG